MKIGISEVKFWVEITIYTKILPDFLVKNEWVLGAALCMCVFPVPTPHEKILVYISAKKKHLLWLSDMLKQPSGILLLHCSLILNHGGKNAFSIHFIFVDYIYGKISHKWK